MVRTGYISFIAESGGGFSSNGNPIEPTKTPTAYFACNLKTITTEYRVYEEGQYKEASYSIIMRRSLVSALDIDSYKEVQLRDAEQNDLGVFQVQSVQYLHLPQMVKIIV